MSLVDALKTPPPSALPRRKVDAILTSVPGPEQQAILDALKSAEWPHESLAEVLTASGHSVSEASIRRYRKAVLGWVS